MEAVFRGREGVQYDLRQVEIYKTRPKLAYGRQGLASRIVWPGYNSGGYIFMVFSKSRFSPPDLILLFKVLGTSQKW